MAEPKIGCRIEVAGRTAHFHGAFGRGPAAVLLHGCGSLGEEILPAFVAAAGGRRLYAVDRPGYGFSDPLPEGREGPDGQADWLAAFLDAVGEKRVLVAAHSLGAGPALCFAARWPERVAGLLLLGPFCRPTPHAAMPVLRAATAPVVGPFIRETLVPLAAPLVGPGMLERANRPNPVPGYLADFPFAHAGRPGAVLAMAAELLAFNGVMAAAERELANCPAPIAVLHGAADRIADPGWHLPWLAGLVPDARIDVLEAVGHAPHHARPERLAGAIRDLAA